MSLVIACFIPTGIVLSGESRSTNTYNTSEPDPHNPAISITYSNSYVASDFENKVFLSFLKYGITVCGDGLIDGFPIQYHIENFESTYKDTKNVSDFATCLKDYFREFIPIPFLFFFVAGYEVNEQFVYRISVAEDEVIRINKDHDGLIYSVSYDGITGIVERLLTDIPTSLTIFKYFNLQDAVDYSRHLILTTINQMKYEFEFPTVGGAIDTLVITRDKAEFIAHKSLQIKN